MSERTDRVQAFVERLLQLVGNHEGHHGVRFDQVVALVREDPEAAAGAVPGLVRFGEQQRAYFQLAMAVAAAYQQVTEDDSLSRVVERAMKSAGVPEPSVHGIGEAEPQVDRELLQLAVDPGDLEQCNVYTWTRLLSLESLEGAQPDHAATLRRMRGRCLLTFPVDADPRAVWEIPETRAYVRALFEAMPYFPYYLHPHPAAGTFLLFFGCLADPEALQLSAGAGEETEEERRIREYTERRIELLRKQGKAIAEEVSSQELNILHPSVIDAVSTTLASLPGFCRALGEDPAPAIEAVMTPYPDDFRKEILSTLLEG